MASGVNVGSIYYEVDADTSKLLRAEAEIDKSIDKQVREFDKADQAVRKYTKDLQQLGFTINKQGQVFNAHGQVSAALSRKYRELAAAANSSKSAAMGVSDGFTESSRNMGRFTQQMQNASYQIQDVAVTLQMGMNPNNGCISATPSIAGAGSGF